MLLPASRDGAVDGVPGEVVVSMAVHILPSAESACKIHCVGTFYEAQIAVQMLCPAAVP